MTKLEQLIQEKCPNGVEYKKLKNVVNVCRGKRLTKSQLNESYAYDVYHGSKDVPLGKYNKCNVEGNTVIVVNTGGIGGVKYIDNDFWCSDGSFYLSKADGIIPKYLYYSVVRYEDYFVTQKRVGGVPTIDRETVENVELPVPPLEVQREIVEILDKFTLLTAELTAELAAELTTRKEQFEYYRNNIFIEQKANKANIKDAIVSLKTGLNPRKNFKLNIPGTNCSYITGKNIFDNKINFDIKTDTISIDDVKLINRRSQLEDNLLLFASTGCSTVGRMAVLDKYDGNWNVSETMYCIKPKNNVNVHYLMHVLYANCSKTQYEPKISQGTVPHLRVDDLLNVKIPLPSYEEQTRIANVLDRFDTLCNDISSGLPAEIEARQKQYEYYRDKLLSFKKD